MPRAVKPKGEGAQMELAEQAAEVTQVKKRGGGGKNSPVIGMNGYMVEPGDHAKFTINALEIMKLPKIDIRNIDQVNERLEEYFRITIGQDMKPAVAGMAMALGISRQMLWAITHDAPVSGKGNMANLPADCTDSIKKAYASMELLWEDYMLHGKINPVTGIFLAKNNFGYQDKQEMVLTPNTNEAMQSPQELERKYLEAVPDEE